ncbi:MAG: hypothetical protein WBO71_12985, partial [Thermoanaerobaculia bacterium]
MTRIKTDSRASVSVSCSIGELTMHKTITLLFLGLVLAAGVALAVNASPETQSVIGQGPNDETVKRLVLEVGGKGTHELAIIRAVGAEMTAAQLERLTALAPELKIYG